MELQTAPQRTTKSSEERIVPAGRIEPARPTELVQTKQELSKKPTDAQVKIEEIKKVPAEETLREKESRSLARSSVPKSDGTRSLIRTLGLKVGRIVIDPGHGGHDTGTVGPSGLQEKHLVLDIALKLKTLVEAKLGSEVLLTREDDTFIPLEERTAMANQSQADLFLSIHANSSRSRRVSGVETFFLDFASSAEAEETAARENSSAQKTIFELQDLVQKITLKEKVDESRELAQIVQKSVTSQLQKAHSQTRDRGVKQAPFIVLIGANMPSILSEVSFVSNPSDEKLLKSSSYRQKLAEALCRGIEAYAEALGGIKTAQNLP
jgi:N-acetylmuramoyl-L-alanine amidase